MDIRIKQVEKTSNTGKYDPKKHRPSFYPIPKKEIKEVVKKEVNQNVISTNIDGDTFEKGRTR